MIADVATKVTGLDYDISAVEHVRARYPRVEMLHGNLAELPLADNSVDVVVNFQVIEHLWIRVSSYANASEFSLPAVNFSSAPPTGSPSPRPRHAAQPFPHS